MGVQLSTKGRALICVVGIGFACAATFAAHGANVVVVDRDPRAAQQGVDAIVAAGGQSMPVVADLLDEAQVLAAAEAALEAFGRIDVVQNNVGLVRLGGPEDLTLAEWRAAVSINLDSAFAPRPPCRTSSRAEVP